MRAFVAVVPPAGTLEPLRLLVERLRPAYGRLGWVAPERWHVTLQFLGDVPEPKLTRLQPRLAAVAAAIGPFHLVVRGGGAFPNPRRARVVWAGLAGDVAAVAELASGVRAAARHSRIALDATPFRPHVTLARVRRTGFDRGPDLVAALADATGPDWPVTELLLMRSHLGPHPRYEPLAVFPLGAG